MCREAKCTCICVALCSSGCGMWGSGLCHQDVLTYVCLWSSCLGWVGHKKATNASPGGLGLHPLPTKQPEVTPGFVPEAQTSVLPHGEGKLSCNSCSMPYSSLRPPEEEPSSRCADTAPRASAFVICLGLHPEDWATSCLGVGALPHAATSNLPVPRVPRRLWDLQPMPQGTLDAEMPLSGQETAQTARAHTAF